MKNSMNKYKILAMLLGIIGLVMIVLGIKLQILPPALTGVGFVLIAYYMFAKQ